MGSVRTLRTALWLVFAVAACFRASSATSPYFFTDPEFVIAGPVSGSGDDFAKSLVAVERTGDHDDETNAMVYVAAPRANNGVGALYAYRVENVIFTAASRFSAMAALMPNATTDLYSPGNVTMLGVDLVPGTFIPGGLNQHILTGAPFVARHSPENIVVNATRLGYARGTCMYLSSGAAPPVPPVAAASSAAQSSSAAAATPSSTAQASSTWASVSSSSFTATMSATASSASASATTTGVAQPPPFEWAVLSCPVTTPSDAIMQGDVYAFRADQYIGFSNGGSFFAPSSSVSLCRSVPGAVAPLTDCNAQLGASTTKGRLRARVDASDAVDIVAGAPLAEAAIAYSLPSGSYPGWTAAIRPSSAGDGPQYFGTSVASGASIDGDGLDDVVVGSPRATDEGSMVAYAGSITGYSLSPNPTEIFRAYGTQSGAYFGWKVLLSDVLATDADFSARLADVVVSAPLESVSLTPGAAPSPDVGCIYVFLGSGVKSGPFVPYAHRICGTVAGGRFGYSLASLGDVDLDGLMDFAVGAPFSSNSNGDMNAGCVHVFFGRKGTLPSTADQVICGAVAQARYGLSMGGGIDLTKMDGFDKAYNDLIVGSVGERKVRVFRAKAVAKLSVAASADTVSYVWDGRFPKFTFTVSNEGPSAATRVIVDYTARYTCGDQSGVCRPESGTLALPTIDVGGSKSASTLLTRAYNSTCCDLVLTATLSDRNAGAEMVISRDSRTTLTPPLRLAGCVNTTLSPVSACSVAELSLRDFVMRPAPAILGQPVVVAGTVSLDSWRGIGDSIGRVHVSLKVPAGATVKTDASTNVDCRVASPSVPSSSSDNVGVGAGVVAIDCYLQSEPGPARRLHPFEVSLDTSRVDLVSKAIAVSATLIANIRETRLDDNVGSASVDVAPAKVVLTSAPSASRVVGSYPFSFVAIALNKGGRGAFGMGVSLVFPVLDAYVGAIAVDGGSCGDMSSGGVLVCTADVIPPGGALTVRVSGVPRGVSDKDGAISMTASISSDREGSADPTAASSLTSLRRTLPKSAYTTPRQTDDSDVGWALFIGVFCGLIFLVLFFAGLYYLGLLHRRPSPPWEMLFTPEERAKDEEKRRKKEEARLAAKLAEEERKAELLARKRRGSDTDYGRGVGDITVSAAEIAMEPGTLQRRFSIGALPSAVMRSQEEHEEKKMRRASSVPDFIALFVPPPPKGKERAKEPEAKQTKAAPHVYEDVGPSSTPKAAPKVHVYEDIGPTPAKAPPVYEEVGPVIAAAAGIAVSPSAAKSPKKTVAFKGTIKDDPNKKQFPKEGKESAPPPMTESPSGSGSGSGSDEEDEGRRLPTGAVDVALALRVKAEEMSGTRERVDTNEFGTVARAAVADFRKSMAALESLDGVLTETLDASGSSAPSTLSKAPAEVSAVSAAALSEKLEKESAQQKAASTMYATPIKHKGGDHAYEELDPLPAPSGYAQVVFDKTKEGSSSPAPAPKADAAPLPPPPAPKVEEPAAPPPPPPAPKMEEPVAAPPPPPPAPKVEEPVAAPPPPPPAPKMEEPAAAPPPPPPAPPAAGPPPPPAPPVAAGPPPPPAPPAAGPPPPPPAPPAAGPPPPPAPPAAGPPPPPPPPM